MWYRNWKRYRPPTDAPSVARPAAAQRPEAKPHDDCQRRRRTASSWYRTMVRIRLFEEKVQELFMSGQIQGTTHLCQGQEAVSVGAIAAMQPGDVQTNTYRGHGEALALGMTPETAFAELMGRTTGGSGGVGGSMHLIDFSQGQHRRQRDRRRGPADRGRRRGGVPDRRASRNVALTFFGDGATNIGTFHEALNMAAVWKAPVVFIITNNLYGEYSPLRDDDARSTTSPGAPTRTASRHHRRRPGRRCRPRRRSARRSSAPARGDGPSLLEMKTYRYRGHSRSDPAKYRPEGELDALEGARPDRAPRRASSPRTGCLEPSDAGRDPRRDPGRDRRRRRARRGRRPTRPSRRPAVCLR